MPVLFVPTYYQPQDNNGALLPGGKVYTYAAGTTTPKATFTDASGSVQATNPIILDAGGKSTIWLDGSYKFVVTSADGSFSVTTDNVTSFVPGGGSSIDINGLSSTTPDFADTTPFYDLSATSNRKSSLASLLGLLPYYITGYMPQNIGGINTTANMTISGGVATSSNTPDIIQSPNLNWAVTNGNNANGFEGGTTLPNSSTIHFFVAKGTGGVTSFASTSLSPNLPSAYSFSYRRTFSLTTSATGALNAINPVEMEGGSFISYLVNPLQDYASVPGTTGTLITLPSVPLGIKHQPLLRTWSTTTTVGTILLTSPDETDSKPSSFNGVGGVGYDQGNTANYQGYSVGNILTVNTLSQVRIRSTGGINYIILTRGWKDFRRA